MRGARRLLGILGIPGAGLDIRDQRRQVLVRDRPEHEQIGATLGRALASPYGALFAPNYTSSEDGG
jgi:hypothetical protein